MPDRTPVSAPATAPTTAIQLLRHALATLAYRAAKVLRNVPGDFPDFRPSPSSRSPLEVLSHLGDLMEWAERMAHGEQRWQPSATTEWTAGRAASFGGWLRSTLR